MSKHADTQKRIEELKRVYEIAIKTRDFEITNLIHRNNFYMVFQGVLLAYVLATTINKPYVEFIICCCGLAISWFQLKMSAGSKYWQEYWEMKVSDIEEKLSQCFEKDEFKEIEFIRLFKLQDEKSHTQLKTKIVGHDYNCLLRNIILKKYSVSRQPIYTALVLLITWFILFLHGISWDLIGNLKPFQIIDGFSYKQS